MSYSDLLQTLYRAGFTRIERDDRLLDIFPEERREKGIELWECWDTKKVHILRVRLPFTVKKLQIFAIPRPAVETALAHNIVQNLATFSDVHLGNEALATLLRLS